MLGAAPSDAALRLEKKALREAILARRDSLAPELRAHGSQLITQKLFALAEYRAARVIAAYASFGSEFDTSAFLAAALAGGKRLVLPRMVREPRSLELCEVRDFDADLAAGVWGIREPRPHCQPVAAREVDFVLVPGVAATIRGERIGYGGGYYDRLLAGLSPGIPKVLALFSVQLVDRVPFGPNDQRVDRVVTEAGDSATQ